MTLNPSIHRSTVVAAAVMAALALPLAASAASWTRLTNLAPATTETMLLLTDGSVLVHSFNGTGNQWLRLSPSATGSYVDGSWSTAANSGRGRLYFASHVLPNGNVWVLGGEYSDPNLTANWTNTGEIYNTLTNSWTPIPNHPEAQYGDVPSMLLDQGKILAGSLFTLNTYIYDLASNTWSAPITKAYNESSDEETWVKLPNGTVLTYDLFQSINTGGAYAEVYQPKTGTWAGRSPSDATAAGSIPQLSSPSVGYELGGALVLRSPAQGGTAFFIGATGHTATYNVGTNTWATGPDIIGTLPGGAQALFGADDAPAAELPNGHIVLSADAGPTLGVFSGPTQVFDYNPTSNTIAPVQPALPFTLPGASYTVRMLMLPTGQMLFGRAGTDLWVYTPDGRANAKSKPLPQSVHYEGGGLFTLTGKRLNGVSSGSSYGDDAESDENYPIVSVKDAGGFVYYARTTAWSSTGVQVKKSETVNFTLKSGTPAGTVTLTVSGAGIASNPLCMTLTAEEVSGTGAAADVPLFACPAPV
jgi:hypothetical protein